MYRINEDVCFISPGAFDYSNYAYMEYRKKQVHEGLKLLLGAYEVSFIPYEFYFERKKWRYERLRRHYY